MGALNDTYNFSLSTISPVSIGNEQEAVSSFLEYIYDEKELYFIDLGKIPHATAEQITNFTSKIETDNNRFRANLEKLIKESFGVEFDTIFTGEKYPISFIQDTDGELNERQLVLKRMLKTRNRPFLSGSTLKGAIKAAILYNWLKNDNNGKRYLKELSEKIDKDFEGIKGILEKYTKLAKNFEKKEEDTKNMKQLAKQLNEVVSGIDIFAGRP